MNGEDLREYVGGNSAQQDFIDSCWAEAVVLVEGFVGTKEIPDEIMDRAYLEVGSELFHRRSAPNGIAQFASFDGSPVRVARDPMVAAYPILAPFVGPGLA